MPKRPRLSVKLTSDRMCFVQVEFQNKLLPPTTTWTDLRGMVKAAPKPWAFVFQSDTPLVEEAEEEEEEESEDDDAL